MSSATLPSPVNRRRDDSWWIFLVTILASIFLHYMAFEGLSNAKRRVDQPPPIVVEIIQVEPPKPPEPPPPPKEEEKPKPPPPKLKPPPVKVAVDKPPPPEPPPPNEEAKEPPKEPPPLVVGVTMSSTSTAGAIAAPVGNTAYGKVEKTAVDPNSVKPYWAPKYVPPGSADRDPVLEVDCKTDYPAEAKSADIEGTVRMRITVDDQGKVVEVKMIPPTIGYGLDEAAKKAILRCKFKPAIKGGEPVATSFVYNYTFQLD